MAAAAAKYRLQGCLMATASGSAQWKVAMASCCIGMGDSSFQHMPPLSKWIHCYHPNAWGFLPYWPLALCQWSWHQLDPCMAKFSSYSLSDKMAQSCSTWLAPWTSCSWIFLGTTSCRLVIHSLVVTFWAAHVYHLPGEWGDINSTTHCPTVGQKLHLHLHMSS